MDINIRPEIQTAPIVRPEVQSGRGGKNDPVTDLSARSDLSVRDRVRLAARNDLSVRNQRPSEEGSEPGAAAESEGSESSRPSAPAGPGPSNAASVERALTAALDRPSARSATSALSAATLRATHDAAPRISSEYNREPPNRAALDRASSAYRQAGQLSQASVTRVSLNIGPGGGRGGLVPA